MFPFIAQFMFSDIAWCFSFPLNVQTINWENFRISLLNRNYEATINFKLVLLTQNSLSLEALCACVIVVLSKNFLSEVLEQLAVS